MSAFDTCPECGRFKKVCWCKTPVLERCPTSREIKEYIGLDVNEGFIGGFKAGWWAYYQVLKKDTSIEIPQKEDNELPLGWDQKWKKIIEEGNEEAKTT